MSAALLLGYAGALSLLAPRLLAKRWSTEHPRWALSAWAVVGASWLLSVLLAAPAVLDRREHRLGVVGDLITSCLALVGVEVPGGVLRMAAAGVMGLSAALAIRLAAVLVAGGLRAARVRAATRRALCAVASPLDHRGPPGVRRRWPLWRVPTQAPAVFSLAGRRPIVAVSDGALARLDREALDAVITHETAHLAQRHHLAIHAAGSLSRAMPFARWPRTAAAQVATLVEYAADDAAVHRGGHLPLARALAALGSAAERPPPLGSAVRDLSIRADRLRRPRPEGRRLRAARCAVALVVVPLVPLTFTAWHGAALQLQPCAAQEG